MKAVFARVPEDVLEWRRRSNADQWDEVWDGVLHMAPSPNCDHQDFEFTLEMWLRQNWAAPNGFHVYHQINIADPDADKWQHNYRIPDLVLLTAARRQINQNEFFNGGPDAVVEIRSADDESYEKLPFYFKVGVREVWIIDRDSKQAEIFEPTNDGGYQLRQPNAEGWVYSQVAGAEFRAIGDGKLEIRMVNQPQSLAKLP